MWVCVWRNVSHVDGIGNSIIYFLKVYTKAEESDTHNHTITKSLSHARQHNSGTHSANHMENIWITEYVCTVRNRWFLL